MPSVDELPSGKHRVRLTADGRRQTHTFDTRPEAEHFLQSYAGPSAVPAARTESDAMRYDTWVRTWFAHHAPTIKPATAYRYRRALNLWIIPHFGFLPIDQITAGDVRGWQARLLKSGLAPKTLRLYRTILGATLKMAVDDGLLLRNPVASVKPVRVPKHHVRILHESEVRALADTIKPRWRALVLMGGYCGLRIGELCALRLDDLDWQDHTISIAKTVTRGELGNWTEGRAKTDQSVRVVTMPKFLVRELEHHIDAGYANSKMVFTGTRGGSLSPNHFRKFPWAKATKACDIDGVVPHDLRHTAVSLWIRQGASATLVAYRAGHKSASYVLDTYGHLFDHEDAELAAKLDGAWVTEEAGPGADAHRVRGGEGPVDLL